MQMYLALAVVAACVVPMSFLLLNERSFWTLVTSEGVCSALVMVGAAAAGLWASDATTAPVALATFIPIAQIIYARGLRLVVGGFRSEAAAGAAATQVTAREYAVAGDRLFRYLFLLPGLVLPPLAIEFVAQVT